MGIFDRYTESRTLNVFDEMDPRDTTFDKIKRDLIITRMSQDQLIHDIKESLIDRRNTSVTREDLEDFDWDRPADLRNFYDWVAYNDMEIERAIELSPCRANDDNLPRPLRSRVGDMREWSIPADPPEQRRMATTGNKMYHIEEDGIPHWMNQHGEERETTDVSNDIDSWFNARWLDLDAERYAETEQLNSPHYNYAMAALTPTGNLYGVVVKGEHVVGDRAMIDGDLSIDTFEEVPRDAPVFSELYHPFDDTDSGARFHYPQHKVVHEAETSREASRLYDLAVAGQLPDDVGTPRSNAVVVRVDAGAGRSGVRIAADNRHVEDVKAMKKIIAGN